MNCRFTQAHLVITYLQQFVMVENFSMINSMSTLNHGDACLAIVVYIHFEPFYELEEMIFNSTVLILKRKCQVHVSLMMFFTGSMCHTCLAKTNNAWSPY
jgi:hypothetical protein